MDTYSKTNQLGNVKQKKKRKKDTIVRSPSSAPPYLKKMKINEKYYVLYIYVTCYHQVSLIILVCIHKQIDSYHHKKLRKKKKKRKKEKFL